MVIKFINPLSKAVAKYRTPYNTIKADPAVLKAFSTKAESAVGDIFAVNHYPEITGKPLDKMSGGCIFFGVDSWENLTKKLENHITLSQVKSKWVIEGYDSGQIINMPICIYLDDLSSIQKGKNTIYSNIGGTLRPSWNYIDDLNSQKAGKWTLYSEKYFGKSSLGAMTHTIGLVPNKRNLLVLDSLGESTDAQKMFHGQIKELLSEAGYQNIIFSTKVQQPIYEFSCNNWTYANIESVLNYIARNGNFEIHTSDELNKLLREDINEILNEQRAVCCGVNTSFETIK